MGQQVIAKIVDVRRVGGYCRASTMFELPMVDAGVERYGTVAFDTHCRMTRDNDAEPEPQCSIVGRESDAMRPLATVVRRSMSRICPSRVPRTYQPQGSRVNAVYDAPPIDSSDVWLLSCSAVWYDPYKNAVRLFADERHTCDDVRRRFSSELPLLPEISTPAVYAQCRIEQRLRRRCDAGYPRRLQLIDAQGRRERVARDVDRLLLIEHRDAGDGRRVGELRRPARIGVERRRSDPCVTVSTPA